MTREHTERRQPFRRPCHDASSGAGGPRSRAPFEAGAAPAAALTRGACGGDRARPDRRRLPRGAFVGQPRGGHRARHHHLTDTVTVDGEERDVVSIDGVPIGPTWQGALFPRRRCERARRHGEAALRWAQLASDRARGVRALPRPRPPPTPSRGPGRVPGPGGVAEPATAGRGHRRRAARSQRSRPRRRTEAGDRVARARRAVQRAPAPLPTRALGGAAPAGGHRARSRSSRVSWSSTSPSRRSTRRSGRR